MSEALSNSGRELSYENYLLGRLDEQDRTRMELEFFGDDSKFLKLQAVESDLIKRYAEGRLLPEEEEDFELHYLVTQARLERVLHTVEAILEAHTVVPITRQARQRSQMSRRQIVAWAVAAGLLFAVATVVWRHHEHEERRPVGASLRPGLIAGKPLAQAPGQAQPVPELRLGLLAVAKQTQLMPKGAGSVYLSSGRGAPSANRFFEGAGSVNLSAGADSFPQFHEVLANYDKAKHLLTIQAGSAGGLVREWTYDVYNAENKERLGRATVTKVVDGENESYSTAKFRVLPGREVEPHARLYVVYPLRPRLREFQQAVLKNDAGAKKKALHDFIAEAKRLRQSADVTHEEKRVLAEWIEAAMTELRARDRR
jgi:hypothetical protein